MARKTRSEAGAELARSLMSDPEKAPPPLPTVSAVTADIAKGSSMAFGFDEEIPPPDFAQRDALPPPKPTSSMKVDGSQVGGAPDAAQILKALADAGIRLTLPDVAGWTPDDRQDAWHWATLGDGEPVTIPQWLALFVGRKLREVVKQPASAQPGPFPRAPDGHINNCRLANEGGVAAGCQICMGVCPDAKKFAPASVPPPAPKHADTDRHPPPMPPRDEPARPPLFATANKGPGITTDFQKIVETVYAIDALRDYADLEANLQVGEERVNYTVLMQHLDKAEDRARRAHRLYLGAKLELEGWEQDAKKVTSVMRASATEALEDEKAAGERKKAITNPDVDAKMSEMFADEYAAQAMTRARLKGTVEHIEWLANLWRGRCHSLGTMLANLRK